MKSPISEFEHLHADRMRAALRSGVIGREITVLENTSSTNDEIAKLAEAGSAEGAVIFAEHQTAGRGQRGNSWESTAGKGLWFSFLLRPGLPVKQSGMLTSWAARVVADTIRDYCGIETRVKPPNDIYISDRKVAGVLVEMKAQPGAPHYAIVGIGINVNHTPADFPEPLRDRATSLLIAVGLQHRTGLAIALLRNLDSTYALRKGRLETL